jgi:hypothetical protein
MRTAGEPLGRVCGDGRIGHVSLRTAGGSVVWETCQVTSRWQEKFLPPRGSAGQMLGFPLPGLAQPAHP